MPRADARGGAAARNRLPRSRRRHGRGGGHRRGGQGRGRIPPADRLGPSGAGDCGRIPLHRLHVEPAAASLDGTLLPFQRSFPAPLPAPHHRIGAFVHPAGLSGALQHEKHLCAGQPLGRARSTHRTESQSEIPLREGDDVQLLPDRSPQHAHLFPAQILPRPRPAGSSRGRTMWKTTTS